MLPANWLTLHVVAVLFFATFVRSTFGFGDALIAVPLLAFVLPVGLLQTWAAVDRGYWYARSAEFLHTPPMATLRWLRVIGDTVFAAGAIAFVVAVAQLTLARSRSRKAHAGPDSAISV